MRLPTHIPVNPPGDGPVHWRWYDTKHFWPWIAERIAWLDAEALKFKSRKATVMP